MEMLADLREINRIVLAINEITVNNRSVKRKDVIDECKKVILGGHIPNHDDTIKFCILCKLIEEDVDKLKLTVLGKSFFRLNDERIYDLNFEQKNFLVLNCFIEGFFNEQTKKLIKQFESDNRLLTFIFSFKSGIPLKADPQYIFLLKQAGFLEEKKDFLIVNPEYAEVISLLIKPKRKMTDAELQKRLKTDRIIGKIAEKIVLKYEQNRLKKEKALPESDLVQIISATFVNAGYDIESFDGKNKDLMFNRFIEVKGSTGKKLSFFWSAEEIEVAKEKESQYWIYFVPEIDQKNETFKGEILKIRDPYEDIIKNEKYHHECVKTHVTNLEA